MMYEDSGLTIKELAWMYVIIASMPFIFMAAMLIASVVSNG